MRTELDQIFLGLFGLVAVVLVTTATVIVPTELAPFLDQFEEDADVYPIFAARAGAPQPFVSLAALKMDLDRCVKLDPASLVDGEGKGPSHVAVLDVCQQMAEAAVAGAPHFAYGWYIAAGTALRTGEEARAHGAYVRSVATNPAEAWIAQLRFQVFDRPGTPLPARLATAADRDVAVLLIEGSTVELVARRYLKDPGFRRRVSVIAEALPRQKQADFVHRIRALMAKDASQTPVPGSG